MRRGRGRARGFHLETSTAISMTMLGTLEIRIERLILLAAKLGTPGVYTTCTAMFGNGLRIAGMVTIIARHWMGRLGWPLQMETVPGRLSGAARRSMEITSSGLRSEILILGTKAAMLSDSGL